MAKKLPENQNNENDPRNDKDRELEEKMLSGIYSPRRRDLILKDPATLTVGMRLRRERYLRKWSQEKMAAYLGISSSYLGALERGERIMSSAMYSKFHFLLNLSYDYLHDGIQLSGESISQYVRESTNYSLRHNIDVLLGVCTEEELEVCYEMIHSFLIRHRKKTYDFESSRAKRRDSRFAQGIPESELSPNDPDDDDPDDDEPLMPPIPR